MFSGFSVRVEIATTDSHSDALQITTPRFEANNLKLVENTDRYIKEYWWLNTVDARPY